MAFPIGRAGHGLMILRGDARHIPLADESVQCVITSPPYWGLRDYQTGRWAGGAEDCDHRIQSDPAKSQASSGLGGSNRNCGNALSGYGDRCGKCGARRIDSQIGLERSIGEYVETMVAVFREVWRVLRDDGVVWLNLGDSYAGGGNYRGINSENTLSAKQNSNGGARCVSQALGALGKDVGICKPKDLCGIPWRVAFALQADGWYLRSDIIWAKPNPMPESVTDRPTRSHEYLFLLAKGQHRTRTIAFSDIEPEAVHFGLDFGKQRTTTGTTARLCVGLATAFFYAAQLQSDFSLPAFYAQEWKQRTNGSDGDFVASLPAIHRMAAHSARLLNAETSTKQFLCEIHGLWRDLREADHFLIGRALAESSDPPGVLVDCNTSVAINNSGKPRKVDFRHGTIIDTVATACNYYYDAAAIREPNLESSIRRMQQPWNGETVRGHPSGRAQMVSGGRAGGNAPMANVNELGRNRRSVWTINTEPYPESHFATFPKKLVEPCILAGSRPRDLCFDPFGGSGTVGEVCEALGRRWVTTELSHEYCLMALRRTAQRGLFT